MTTLRAQAASNVRMTVETGFSLSQSDAEGLSLLLGIEPKVKILKRTYAGLRFGFMTNTSRYIVEDLARYNLDTGQDNALVFFTPNVSYYPNPLQYKGRAYAFYLSIGLGYYLLNGIALLDTNTGNTIEVDVENRLGFNGQIGVEMQRLKIGLGHQFISDGVLTDVSDNDQRIGEVANSYWALSVGYIFSW